MAVSGTTNNTAVSNTTTLDTTTAKNSLDKDAFLKLLVTELRAQDPSNAMDDKQFIAQLAQFSSLEQTSQMATGLQNLALSNASTQAIDMIGKSVQYIDPGSGDTLSGKVSTVGLTSDGPQLKVGDALLSLSDIVGVS